MEAVRAEGPLGPLAAALRELRAAMTDPTQYDGEDMAVRRAVCSGCWEGRVDVQPWPGLSVTTALADAEDLPPFTWDGMGDGSVVQAVTDPQQIEYSALGAPSRAGNEEEEK